ncbi:alpha/beta fold hydrolase [Mycobacterium sp. AZCC_0083]|uniref:alpha/beta fold hydrolase n=1 Tax=Mycobacterium sp. AZCC_0083 TaxID=2735882 RepID=UPI00160ABBD9|nr:hypothetical protein [Mycobacterium sp. AZCC_0083]MBB5167628.1 3-oxoadipate enol-lactonase [Mycobacterium sp. AZCC_0083]
MAVQKLQFSKMIRVILAAGGVPRSMRGRIVGEFFAPQTQRNNPTRSKQLLDAVNRCEPRAGAHAVTSVVTNRRDRHELFSHICAPTLVVSGRHDRVFPPADSQRMTAAIPGAHLVVIDDAAALLAAEVLDTISTLIEQHISSAEAHHG